MDHILASQPPLALKKQPGPYSFIYILSGTPLPAIGWGTQLLRRDSSWLADFLTKQYAELALRYISQEKSLRIQDEGLINTRMPPFPMCIMLCQCIYGCGGGELSPSKGVENILPYLNACGFNSVQLIKYLLIVYQLVSKYCALQWYDQENSHNVSSLKMLTIYNPAILLLGIHLKETKSLSQKDLHSHVHCSIIKLVKTWKQPGCLSADEWLKKTWYIYTMEYYLAIKKGNLAICNNMDGP